MTVPVPASNIGHGPYGESDPDRLRPPKGESTWGCEEFKKKWYKDQDIEVFREAYTLRKSIYHQHTPMIYHRLKGIISPGPPPLNPFVRGDEAQHLLRATGAGHSSRLVIGLASFWELVVYVSVRQIVTVIEAIVSCRAPRGQLRRKLSIAESYFEWKQSATELDELLGYEAWKKHSSNAYYDSSSVRKVLISLERSRLEDDAEGVKEVLEVCTKTLIENYVDEVEKSIIYIRETPHISAQEKTVFFRRTAKNLGTSALCLSGGDHLGVIKALVDARLLPTVITGASAGSLVAALLCTRTDEELDRILVPELADMITGAEEPIRWLPRFMKTGARFDTVIWAKKSCFFTMGSLTFLEAYERTGRILNVSVIPHDLHSPTTLLNYITAPNCLIFSAILASAAVPLVMNPVVLLEKKKDGTYFNTSFSIVSQVNPHVHLFFFQPRGSPGQPVVHRKGKGWRGGFLLSALEQFLKLELVKNLRVIRDLELLPAEFGGQTFTAVFLQRFEGNVTIWPQSLFTDLVKILEDPSRKDLERMIDGGQRVTWPKIRMIENRLRIERQVFEGRKETKQGQEPVIPQPHQPPQLPSSKSGTTVTDPDDADLDSSTDRENVM
ncbi:hypothetical protein PSHT_12133 [Puccinia striiformis]|uniref:PNPLA domain-containing protein n=1 Tax=Puccinia striiformis TaxID=27350 RepID=A0A2S4UYL9_9BASI|nr:hypothetical protein PSHT_12133 [Puccinia striiformis]